MAPNLQNLTVRSDEFRRIREALADSVAQQRADDIDYSQLELRIAAQQRKETAR